MGSSRSCQPTGPTPYPLMFASPHFLVAKNLIAAQIYLLQHQLLQCQKMEDGCLQSQFGNTFLLKNEWRISPKFDLVKCNRQQGLSLVDFLKLIVLEMPGECISEIMDVVRFSTCSTVSVIWQFN
ncbi:uncharacterized protein LOC111389182 isoform X2 [Olea europaea var. sylvestris]|uniref:uncharacterized protein LOC111389182 isoform X2 n=1 Tax=Olea europaea var. sylvestris TaxID=158386 RepID=UPI000C1CF90B|nr:uncharacterized protein LOC111389182 isoform X2 [Olea europaea var. sylvestris]